MERKQVHVLRAPQVYDAIVVGSGISGGWAAKELCDKVVDRAYYNGLLLLACGKSTLRFMPPLSVTRAEIDEAMAILEQTLTECSAAPPRTGAQAR